VFALLTNDDVFLPVIQYFIERKGTASWQIKKDKICFHDLTYIYKGKATYFVNEQSFELNPGDIIYVPKGSIREAVTDPDDPVHSFAFNFNIAYPSVDDDPLPLDTVFNISEDPYFIKLLREYNIVWLERKDGFSLKASGLFMMILHYIYSRLPSQADKQAADLRIEKLKKYIVNHYHEKIDKETLASLVQLNTVYMGSLFRKKTGYTINEYTQRIRINKACDMLATGEYSVSETALKCGFEDIFYFSKVFKKIIGLSPSEWCKSLKQA